MTAAKPLNSSKRATRNYELDKTISHTRLSSGQLRQLSVDMVRALISAIEQKDEYTSGHSARVGAYALLLGRDLGLGKSLPVGV